MEAFGGSVIFKLAQLALPPYQLLIPVPFAPLKCARKKVSVALWTSLDDKIKFYFLVGGFSAKSVPCLDPL